MASSSNGVGMARAQVGGLAGWIVGLLRRRETERLGRQMHVIETLSLGGRRQLTLVSCAGERYLVGVGEDRIETIVKVGVAE